MMNNRELIKYNNLVQKEFRSTLNELQCAPALHSLSLGLVQSNGCALFFIFSLKLFDDWDRTMYGAQKC